MAKKEVSLSFSEKLIDKSSVPSDASDVVDVRGLTVKLTVVIPLDLKAQGSKIQDRQIDLCVNQAKKAGKPVFDKYRSLVKRQLDAVIPKVMEKHQADANGDTSAYADAKSLLDKANSYIEELFDDLRVDLRESISKGIRNVFPVKAKEMSTFGSDAFKKLSLKRGAFQNEVSYDSDTSDYVDLLKALKKEKNSWHFCGAAVNGTKGYVLADKKRPVKKRDLMNLKQALGGSGVIIEGVCLPQGNKVKFNFLKDSKKTPHKIHLKTGIEEQTDAKFQVEIKDNLAKLPASAAELKKLDADGNPKEK